MSSPIVLVTYHPAAVLHAGKQTAGAKGLSKESILRAIQEDFKRLKDIGTTAIGTIGLPKPLWVSEPIAIGTSPIGIDTEYTPLKELLTIGASDGSTVLAGDRDLGTLQTKYFAEEPHCLVGHNIPEDIAQLWEAGVLPKREEYLTGYSTVDSLLLSRMVYEGAASYALEDLLASLYTVKPWKYKTKDKDPRNWPPKERAERCGLDAWAPIQIVKKQWPLLSSEDRRSLYPFTQSIALTLHRLTLAGAMVDAKDLGEFIQVKELERTVLNASLVNAATTLGLAEFSPQNDGHIRQVLFEKLELPVVERTKKTKEPAVTKEVLDLLEEQAEGGTKGFIKTLKAFNKVDKVLSTYLVGGEGQARNALQKLATGVRIESLGDTLWLPFHFHVLGAKTARRSSSNPNSQNWPKSLRRLVRSRWPGGRILAADYRKLEPVIIAWLAKDAKLLAFFTTGGGYIDVAKELLRTEVKEGTTIYRGVKSIVLGVHYDMGTDEMAKQLWVNHKIRFSTDWQEHWNETNRIRNLYLERFPRVGEYMERRRNEVHNTGLVRTPTGRVRSVGKTFIDKHILNQAINAPVQSTASDVTGSALVDCERAVLDEYKISLVEWYDHLISQRRKYLTNASTYDIIPEQWRIPTMINEVHDEITVDLPPDTWKRDVELFVETMRAVPTLRALAPYLKDMPLYVDPKVGYRWGEEN